MKLRMDRRGHIHVDGRTTQPLSGELFYVGNLANFIAFDALVIGDGRVVLHAMVQLAYDDLQEDFLYEVVRADAALEELVEMVEDAAEHLVEHGFTVVQNPSMNVLFERLDGELAGRHYYGPN